MISGKWISVSRHIINFACSRRIKRAVIIGALLLTSVLANSNNLAATSDQIESIIQHIDTPRDTPIPFTERRSNRLLTEPLALSGEIVFTTDGTLSKQVGEPFHERITISAQRVEFQRKDKTRRLALNRRPDIKAFYVGMQALLAGDATALFESFDVTATTNAARWSLDLTPKEKKLRKFVARLLISGKAAQVLTVRTEQPGGDWQEMSFHATTD